MKFIATIRENGVSLVELEGIYNRYSRDVSNAVDRNFFCYDLRKWIEDSLDTSFSCVNEVMNACQVIVRGSILKSDMAWRTITTFLCNVMTYLPKAWKDCDWPSCKDLLKFSDIDIIEKGKDLVMDKTAKNEIRTVLNLKTVNDVITVGTLARYYLEVLNSIKLEYEQNRDDPRSNKQYIFNKTLQELHYCDCVMLKTGEKIIEEKIKDYLEAQKEYQENNTGHLGSNHIETTIFGQVLPHENDIFI